jgi:GNAT superfamily N-acetyltransferase
VNDQVILEAFRALLGDPASLTEPFEAVLRPEQHSVTLLEVGGAVRLVAPDGLTAQSVQHLMDKDPLFWDHASDSARRVAEAAGWRHNVAEVLGPAHLLCTQTPPGMSATTDALVGAESELAELLARTSPHEVTESGVRDLEVAFGRSAGGRLVAVAGWEPWPGDLAKIGVLVDHEARGRGHGTVVGAVATAEAIWAGLLPLWRAGAGNLASLAVAERLGYEQVGHQLSVVLVPGRA